MFAIQIFIEILKFQRLKKEIKRFACKNEARCYLHINVETADGSVYVTCGGWANSRHLGITRPSQLMDNQIRYRIEDLKRLEPFYLLWCAKTKNSARLTI